MASFVRSLIVPETTNPGTYYFNVDVSYKNFTTSSNAEFRVKGKLNFLQDRFKLVIIIVIIVIIIMGIVLFFYFRGIKRKEDKLEKKFKSLKKAVGKKRGKK